MVSPLNALDPSTPNSAHKVILFLSPHNTTLHPIRCQSVPLQIPPPTLLLRKRRLRNPSSRNLLLLRNPPIHRPSFPPRPMQVHAKSDQQHKQQPEDNPPERSLRNHLPIVRLIRQTRLAVANATIIRVTVARPRTRDLERQVNEFGGPAQEAEDREDQDRGPVVEDCGRVDEAGD